MTLRTLLLAGASLSALACAAHAQSTADIVVLDEIVVEGYDDPTAPVAGYVARNAQTATKTGTSLVDTPQSISVITGEQMEDQGSTDLGDTLRYTSGITAKPFGTDPRFDNPTIRGFEGKNAQYLNGLRLVREFGAPSFESYSLERVEVLKGPASALYGAATTGGMINQIQKRAYNTDFGEAGLGFGNPKASEAFVDLNRALSDTLSLRLTAVARDTEEQIEELTNERRYLGLATRWTPTDRTTVQVLGAWQEDTPITPALIPGTLVNQGNDDDLRSYHGGDPAYEDSDRLMRNIGIEARHEFSDSWAAEVSLRHQSFDWDYRGFYVTGASGDTVTRGASATSETSLTQAFDARLSGVFDTGAVTHSVLVGADYLRYSLRESTAFMFASNSSLSNPTDGSSTIGATWYTEANDLTMTQRGLYAQDELTLGNWMATVALRRDWTEQSGDAVFFNDYASPKDSAFDLAREDAETTGKAAIGYRFDTGVTAYLSYATSFNPTIGANNNGTTFVPTRGTQWELGAKYQPLGYDALFTVALFDLVQENLSTPTTSNGVGDYDQIGEAHSWGVELEATADLGNGWNLRGAYTWNETEQTEGDNKGKQLVQAPETVAALWASYRFDGASALDGLQLGGGLRHTGERYSDAANTTKLDAYTLLDLQASYALADNANLSVNLNNVTDKAYVANCGSFGCSYGDGRAVQARVTYNW